MCELRRLCTLLIAVLALAGGAAPIVARPVSPAIAILPDNLCAPVASGEIRACRPRIARDDIRTLHALADCIVHWQRRSSEAAVADYMARGETARLAALVASDHSCPQAGMARVSGVLLAGAVAEALLAARRPPAAPPPRADGDCMIGIGRAEAVRLIDSDPLSRGEREAFGAMAARLSACVEVGETLRISPLTLRAVTALHLFGEQAPGAAPVPLLSPALDLQGYRSALAFSPGLAITPATLTFERDGPTRARRVPPMTGQPFDPEELLANESLPQIDPYTGETIVRRPGIEARRDSGDPY